MGTTFSNMKRILTSFQSGLLTKADKASRKLRKERKNRAKKVDVLPFPCCSSFDHLSVVSWYQKSQGCRAPEEGQVNVGSLLCHFPLCACHVYTRFMHMSLFILMPG